MGWASNMCFLWGAERDRDVLFCHQKKTALILSICLLCNSRRLGLGHKLRFPISVLMNVPSCSAQKASEISLPGVVGMTQHERPGSLVSPLGSAQAKC